MNQHISISDKLCKLLNVNTYDHFRDITKMVCARFLGLTKTCHLGNIPVLVRNSGELPQPFWLGAACGGGSCSAATVPARA